MKKYMDLFIRIILCSTMLFSSVVPINTYAIKNDNIVKEADNSTVDDYLNVLEDDNIGARYNGRVWTDKSVFANNEDVSKVTLDKKFNVEYDDDFLTVFSALGSSQMLEVQNVMDVLVVIDASGSMAEDVEDKLEHEDEETRIAHSRVQKTVDSVNDLIDTIMAYNKQNRISVVAYGATAYTLMELGHYEKVEGSDTYITVEDFMYYDERSFHTIGSSAYTLRTKAMKDGKLVERSVRNNYTYNMSKEKQAKVDACIGYNTNMQAGIYSGFNELYNNVDTKTVRTPMAIVMTDGGSNFVLKRDNSNQSVGDEWYDVPLLKSVFYFFGNYQLFRAEDDVMGRGGKELMLENLLTASFMKAKVQKKYEEVKNNLNKSSDKSVEFKIHTVSVDTPTPNWQIPRIYTILNPKDYFKKELPDVTWNFKQESINAYNLWEEWKASEDGITSTFYDTEGDRVVLKINKLPGTVDGVTNEDVINNINYNDSFNDIKSKDLDDYFQNVVVNDLFNPIGDVKSKTSDINTLSYTDKIGDYLEVKDVKKLLLFGKEYNIIKDGDAKVSKKDNVEVTTQNYKVVNTDNKDLTITNKSYEEDNNFKLSDIKIWIEKNNQEETLHIDIPKNALPIKLDTISIDAYGEIIDYSSNKNTLDALPIRLLYTVGVKDDVLKDNTFDLDKITDDYKKNNTQKEDNKEYLYFYSNYYSKQNNLGDSFVSFTPSSKNSFYVFQNNFPIYEASSGSNNGEGILSETGGSVKLSKEVKDLSTIDKNKTYYYAIEYYVPSNNVSKGKLIKYAIAQKGSDFYDKNNNSYLTYYNVKTREEVKDKGDDVVVATKVGSPRNINLANFTLNKKDNVTNTAASYNASSYDKENDNSIITYLGNNGVLKFKVRDIKVESTKPLEVNPQTGLIISLNVLLVVGVPLAIYLYTKRKKKLYKVD